MLRNFFTFSRFTLLVALAISVIAAWYSVVGLTAIFAGAVVPIIIMGGILELAKIVTTVWLHRHWKDAGLLIKSYLTTAVIILAILTSMGIFGFLSKAHIDQGLPTGDVAAQVSLIDEKIRTQRENIELARKALAQMDAQVDARLSRGDSENSAERAVQIRRQQATERAKLQKDIADAQKVIAQLNEERAPIAANLRKVEAEVGPIKYIAALIYGDNPDQNILERAVRWVTIIIVVVFDPLAIVLILAANKSLDWERRRREDQLAMSITPPDDVELRPFTEQEIAALDQTSMTPWPTEWTEYTPEPEPTPEAKPEIELSLTPVESVPVRPEPFFQEPVVEPSTEQEKQQQQEEVIDIVDDIIERRKNKIEQTPQPVIEDEQANTVEKVRFSSDQEYVHYEGKLVSIPALRGMRPELVVSPEKIQQPIINFGIKFPTEAFNGELFIRIESIPHRVYKFNGQKWMAVDKTHSTSYLQNDDYLKYLVKKIGSGEYDLDYLTEAEQDEISILLNKK